jgi:hypothetical protein
MIEYLQNIITPFVDEIKEELDLPVRQKALVIFDCFRGRGQITKDLLVRTEFNWSDKKIRKSF